MLRFDPATSAHIEVTAEAAAQAAARDELTMVARVRPSGPTAGPGVIVNKEGEYELARFPDGTLRWALANTTPGWAWVDTGAVAQEQQWTHVAVAYDGETVRTWTDGDLRHTNPADGPIGDAHPDLNELWIGGRAAVPEYFAGDIADVAIFDRGLTEYEAHRLLGRSDDRDGARLWVDDDLPTGAETELDSDDWEWVNDEPQPSAGSRCHRSLIAPGEHLHQFRMSETGFPVDRGDVLATDVWVDPLNPPRGSCCNGRTPTARGSTAPTGVRI